MGLSERELADRSGCSPETVRLLVDFGVLLRREGEEPFACTTPPSRRGHPVKWLGDGVMFHFAEPGEAVLGALDLVEQTQAAIDVRARVGVNAGPVILRERITSGGR